jgi:predicted 2-oxoglutarate/Fe(II)-dependent dioxygenase YbiX
MEQKPQSSPEADAEHYMAIKAAEGIGVPQNWEVALDHLQRSAQLGLRLAQAELAGLSGQWVLARDILEGEAAVPESQWHRFRSSIDLAEWLVPPSEASFSEGPRIATVEDIAAPEICDWLIARARPRLAPATVYDRKKGEHRSSGMRTNSSCPFRGPESDLILAILRARITDVTGMRGHAMESPSVLHYAVGQEFRRHLDIILNPNTPDYAKKFAEGGQRALTLLLSLNDDYEGGETEFPELDIRWKRRKGSALFFWNVQPDGAIDRRMLHAGLPLTRGEKWMFSQWIRS